MEMTEEEKAAICERKRLFFLDYDKRNDALKKAYANKQGNAI